ncbi:DUF559 domain-containing protein [Gordonia sp. NPDC058843]|uniref:DUF559 domain-containing protein n=1 Tax=Gordonia sp. NPDC058843 TaxID=3346648 RepID=UPI0036CA5159
MSIRPSTLDAAVRSGHVLRVDDVDGLALSDLLDSVSAELPVFLDHRGPTDRTAREVVREILDALEDIVGALFPVWLAGHESGLPIDADDAEEMARALCRDAGFPSPAVVHLTRAAAGARRPGSGPADDARAGALTFLLKRGYGRDSVVLAVRADAALPERAQHAAAAAYEWLADHANLTVWLTADALPAVTRVPAIRIGVSGGRRPSPSRPVDVPDDPSPASAAPVLVVSRPSGRPAPHSVAEQTLERALASAPWARDRQWNRSPRDLDPLTPAVIVDLLWATERVVVEVDGADHRGPVKYARDRRRDNMLQRAGYLVLRYTNDHVLDDTALVVAELAAAVAERTRAPSRPTPARPPSTREEHPWTTPS